MAETSRIEWTRSTFNPWIGCTKVGPGCDHCYAETLDKRHNWGGATHWGPGVPRHRTSVHYWNEPLRWSAKAASASMKCSQGHTFTNEARLAIEINDVLAMIEMLKAEWLITSMVDRAAIDRKKAKVEAFLEYSKKCGTLQP